MALTKGPKKEKNSSKYTNYDPKTLVRNNIFIPFNIRGTIEEDILIDEEYNKNKDYYDSQYAHQKLLNSLGKSKNYNMNEGKFTESLDTVNKMPVKQVNQLAFYNSTDKEVNQIVKNKQVLDDLSKPKFKTVSKEPEMVDLAVGEVVKPVQDVINTKPIFKGVNKTYPETKSVVNNTIVPEFGFNQPSMLEVEQLPVNTFVPSLGISKPDLTVKTENTQSVVNNTPAPVTKNTTEDTTNDTNFMQELKRIKAQSHIAELGKLGFNTAGLIDAIGTGTGIGYEAPNFQFTPTASTRDRDLTFGQRNIASDVAKSMTFMQENGIPAAVSGVLADKLNAEANLRDQVAQKEIQRMNADAVRLDDTRNRQSLAKADIYNKNIDKTRQDNQMKAASILGFERAAENNISDILRQKYEFAKVKEFMGNSTPEEKSAYLADSYLGTYGNYKPKRKEKTYRNSVEQD